MQTLTLSLGSECFLSSQDLAGTQLLLTPSQVKVDQTCALEHVTRNRVRGGQRRRPPTRIHLKEVRPSLGLNNGRSADLGFQVLRVAIDTQG